MVDSSSSPQGRDNVELRAGSMLGDYRLKALLETAETGQVFSARDNTSKMPVRLRILTIPSQLDAEARILYLGYFQRQANQITALQHAHILPLLSYGIYSGIPYLAYQHYPMQLLSQYLVQHGPLSVQIAGSFLDQIAVALECGHSQGILHRNLSAECIFVKQDGTLVVADFGVLRMLEQSKAYQPKNDQPVKQHDFVPGMNEASSPAPEQVSGHDIDIPTDVYALGATLYRMLTGHRVFRASTLSEIAQQHLNAPVPPLSNWRHDLPAALDSVMARAMAKDPHQRFSRPGELANAYHEVIAPSSRKRQPFIAAPTPTLAVSGKAQPAFAIERQKRTSIPRRKVLAFLVAGGSAAAVVTIVSIVGIHSLQANTSPIVGTPSTKTTRAASAATSSPTPARQQGNVLAHVSDIPVNSDKQFPLTSSNNPGLLIHLPDNRFVAFDSTCTHAGCSVNYDSQNNLLVCPCHGAVFDPGRNASVVQGPATTPLTAIPIAVHADGSITTGSS